jgi:hypothetical protein
MILHYILDENKQPVAIEDDIGSEGWLRWAEWWSNMDNRRVAWTEVADGIHVSTVFLGTDHNLFGDGPPLLFETLVHTDYGWEPHWRYPTWEAAEKGHELVVSAERTKHMTGVI